MSTLILPYAREHHMGKFSLVAQNRLGHAVSHCDLIVRKKQFPPVFWQRLYFLEAEDGRVAGARLEGQVEVGGWPLPEVQWEDAANRPRFPSIFALSDRSCKDCAQCLQQAFVA